EGGRPGRRAARRGGSERWADEAAGQDRHGLRQVSADERRREGTDACEGRSEVRQSERADGGDPGPGDASGCDREVGGEYAGAVGDQAGMAGGWDEQQSDRPQEGAGQARDHADVYGFQQQTRFDAGADRAQPGLRQEADLPFSAGRVDVGPDDGPYGS